VTGDPNASIDSSEPLVFGPQFGGMGATAAELSVAFVAGASLGGAVDQMPTSRRRVAVKGTRGIGPKAMVRNTMLGDVEVDPSTGAVVLNGEPVASEPAESISLSRLYFF
jgi:urease subunit alpha